MQIKLIAQSKNKLDLKRITKKRTTLINRAINLTRVPSSSVVCFSAFDFYTKVTVKSLHQNKP